jgi:hypothetical protein
VLLDGFHYQRKTHDPAGLLGRMRFQTSMFVSVGTCACLNAALGVSLVHVFQQHALPCAVSRLKPAR